MPAVQCSQCSYPLDDDELLKRACPACGTPLRQVAAFQPLPRPQAAPAVPPPPRRSRLWPLAGVALVALASFGIGVYVHRPVDGQPESPPDSTLAAAPAAKPQEPAKSPPSSKKEPEPPRPAPKAEEPRKEPKPEPPKKEPPPPPPVVKPPPLPLPEVLIGDDRRLDRPDGEYRLLALRGTALKLSGRVKTLRLGIIDAGATLDASALEAQEVVVAGRIDGGSTVKLRVPRGRVEFKSKVDGESRLEIDAPEGTVAFTEPTQLRREGSKIDGDSHVAVMAKVVDFRGAINGTRTRVVVTLTKGGLLSFRELAGSVSLQYRKADPRDPDPHIVGGQVHGAAKLQKID